MGRDRKGVLLIFYPYAGTEAHKALFKGYHIQQQQQKLMASHGPLIRPTLWGPEEQPCSSVLPCSWAHTMYT